MSVEFDVARAALDAGRYDEAIAAFRALLEEEPENVGAWFNLGLAYKRKKQWREMLDCFVRAADLDADEPTWWNLSIAACAVGDWEAARRAFTGIGLTVPDGPGPFDLRLGAVPVRLDPEGVGEVVWCERIDPSRARIASVPLPESRHRYGDIVLTDGEAVGHRTLRGRQVPVFNALARLEESSHMTFQAFIHASDQSDVADLAKLADENDLAFEDWTESIRILCKACSEGNPDEPHHHHEAEPWTPRRKVAFAATLESTVMEALTTWARATPGRGFLELARLA